MQTALSSSLKPVVAKYRGTYILGKFNLHQSSEPYSGIIAAFRELCAEMLTLQKRNGIQYQELCDRLLAKVGCEGIALLANIIPVLHEAMEIPERISSVEQGHKGAKERQRYAFLQFFRVVTNYLGPPLVVVFDDLQWADSSSMVGKFVLGLYVTLILWSLTAPILHSFSSS